VGQSYAITSIQHTATRAEGYRNRFEAIPAKTIYRPPLQTPWPRISGAQTAFVVGASGEEIWPDNYGRIKVMFHWDREAKGDDTSSCWIRCAQSWAGSGWGTLFVPRVGQEVVVTFLEGDPDQPLITGSVANASQMPAYTLPANKTRSYIRSRSSKNGATSDTNEIRLEDLKGSEELYIHAQKDYTQVVENNNTLTVGSSKANDGSQTITIYKDRSLIVQTGNETVSITKGNRATTIKAGNDSLTINKDRSLTVQTGNETVSIEQGNRTVTIQTGNDSLTISEGNLSINITAGTGTIEAGQTITLKVGASSLVVNQQGVTIKGPAVSVQGTTSAQVQAPSTQVSGSATLALSAPSTQVSGSGTLALSGGVVNIN
jgi:type VI secretion system secreted protein VgrG